MWSGLPLSPMGILVASDDCGLSRGDAAQVRQCRRTRPDRPPSGNKHPPCSDPDEATHRSARRGEVFVRRFIARHSAARRSAVSSGGQAIPHRVVGSKDQRVLRLDRRFGRVHGRQRTMARQRRKRRSGHAEYRDHDHRRRWPAMRHQRVRNDLLP